MGENVADSWGSSTTILTLVMDRDTSPEAVLTLHWVERFFELSVHSDALNNVRKVNHFKILAEFWHEKLKKKSLDIVLARSEHAHCKACGIPHNKIRKSK